MSMKYMVIRYSWQRASCKVRPRVGLWRLAFDLPALPDHNAIYMYMYNICVLWCLIKGRLHHQAEFKLKALHYPVILELI